MASTSSRLQSLGFMNRANIKRENEETETTALDELQASGGGHQPVAAQPVSKCSSKLMGLKFMQKAAQKHAAKQHIIDQAQRLEEERFVVQSESLSGCVVVQEDTPMAGSTGRMSFGNFNPAVEKSNAELQGVLDAAQEEIARRADTITDREMASKIGKRKSRHVDVKEEDGETHVSLVRIKSEGDSETAGKRRRDANGDLSVVAKLKKMKKVKSQKS